MAIRGHKISVALASFEPKSPFWSEEQPFTNSVVRTWKLRDALRLEVLTENALNRLQSFTQGSKFYLGWRNQPASDPHEQVISLADRLDRITDTEV